MDDSSESSLHNNLIMKSLVDRQKETHVFGGSGVPNFNPSDPKGKKRLLDNVNGNDSNVKAVKAKHAHYNGVSKVLLNRYSTCNKGPYIVLVESRDTSSLKLPMVVGKIFHSDFPLAIRIISKSNRLRVTVECFNGKSENSIVENKHFLPCRILMPIFLNFNVS